METSRTNAQYKKTRQIQLVVRDRMNSICPMDFFRTTYTTDTTIWEPGFNISNYSIDRVKEVTFLGVILDEHLTWKSHIHNAARKVSKAVGIIYKSSFCLDNSSLRILYFSLIYPYLFYCVSVWASSYPSNLRRLITLQKRVIRMMSRSVFDAHTDPLFTNSKS